MMGRDYRTIMRALGFKPTNHLPPDGMPVRLIDGVPVYVKSKNGKVLERRVIAICSCGEHVPVGYFSRHRLRCSSLLD